MSSKKETLTGAETSEVKTDGDAVKAEGKQAEAAKADAKPAEKKAEKEETKAAKKPAAKKTAAKKSEKPELKPQVYIEYQGRQAADASVVDRVKAAFVASGHRVSSIKSLQIYIKPEEFKAYYVINDGKYTGDVDLF